MGSLVHDLGLARGDFGRAGELRFRVRTGEARVPRALDADDDAYRGDSVRLDERGNGVGLGDDPLISRLARPLGQRRELHSIHADRLAHDLRYGP